MELLRPVRVITYSALPVKNAAASKENIPEHIDIIFHPPVFVCCVFRDRAFERTFLASCVISTRSDSARFEYAFALPARTHPRSRSLLAPTTFLTVRDR